MHKKTWRKPKLLILIKVHPEEAVLSACKNGILGEERVYGGSNTTHTNCVPGNMTCVTCDSITLS